jgi:hypothetical protein
MANSRDIELGTLGSSHLMNTNHGLCHVYEHWRFKKVLGSLIGLSFQKGVWLDMNWWVGRAQRGKRENPNGAIRNVTSDSSLCRIRITPLIGL